MNDEAPVEAAVHKASVSYGAAQEDAIAACDHLEALTVLRCALKLSSPREAPLSWPETRDFQQTLDTAIERGPWQRLDTAWQAATELGAEVASQVLGCDYEPRERDGCHVRSDSDRGATWLEYRPRPADAARGLVRFEATLCIHRTHEDIDNRFETLTGEMAVGRDGAVNWASEPAWTDEARVWVTAAAAQAGLDVENMHHEARELSAGIGYGLGDLPAGDVVEVGL